MSKTPDLRTINLAIKLVGDGLRSGELPAENFDIYRWPTCDTRGCIGYWAERALWIAGYKINLGRITAGEEYTRSNRALAGLLVFDLHTKRTPAKAALAIDRYLASQPAEVRP